MIFATVQELSIELTEIGMQVPKSADEVVLECHTKLDYAYLYFYSNTSSIRKILGGHRLDAVDREPFFKFLN